MDPNHIQPLPSSYRDSDGFVFIQDGTVYRFVRQQYESQYTTLMSSGLYDVLVKKGWLIAHVEVDGQEKYKMEKGRVLQPEQIPFISYPYEWSFNMWKDAALVTLQIATFALQKKMLLKDATPFNIQFHKGKPVFIDSLSFEHYIEGEPWVAYRQFCECFLAPLLLMHYGHADFGKLYAVYPDGIPMNLLVKLLPKRSKWNLNTFLHVHLQAKMAKGQAGKPNTENNFSKKKFEILLKGLAAYVQQLKPAKTKTTWDDYYTDTILGDDYLLAKKALIESYIDELNYSTVLDLGANDGYFSLIFPTEKKIVSVDGDTNCINSLYNKLKQDETENILPLVINLAAPSPAIGWNNAERESFPVRMKADLVLALALVHHVAIGHNIPLAWLADWLSPMGEKLIIEFVPKEDEKVKILLQNREDIFDKYSPANFKEIFSQKYHIVKEDRVGKTNRVLFLMKRKS